MLAIAFAGTTARADGPTIFKPFSDSMRVIVRSHPSGVLRRNEMRESCCLSSGRWQPAHAFTTVWSVTGIPASAFGAAAAAGAGGVCAPTVAAQASANSHEHDSVTTEMRAVFAMI